MTVAPHQARRAERPLGLEAGTGEGWMVRGILELVCTVGPIVPAGFRWQPLLMELASTQSRSFAHAPGVFSRAVETLTQIDCRWNR